MTGRVQDMIIDPKQTGQPATRSSPRAATTACRRSTRRCSSTSRPAASRWRTRCAAPPRPHDFKLLVAADGRKGTTMDDLERPRPSRQSGDATAPSLRRAPSAPPLGVRTRLTP